MTLKIKNKQSHGAFMLQKLSKARGDQFCDVNLNIGDVAIPAHKLILSAASEFFENLFKSVLPKSEKSEVDLADLKAESIELILQYIYSGVLACESNVLLDLYRDVDFLQIEALKNLVYNLIVKNLTVESVIETWELFEQLKTEQESVIDFIYEGLPEMIVDENFLSLPVQKLPLLLGQLTKNFEAEECEGDSDKCYEAVMAWISHDMDQRHEKLPHLLQLLNTANFSHELVQKLEYETILRNDFKCVNWLLDLVYHRNRYQTEDGPKIFCFEENGEILSVFHTKTGFFKSAPTTINGLKGYSTVSIDSKIYIVGGYMALSTLSTLCYTYDTITCIWGSFTFPCQVYAQRMCAFEKNIYIFGGADSNYHARKLVKYDVKSGSLTDCQQIPVATDNFSICEKDNFIFLTYVDGRHSLQTAKYSPRNNSWHKNGEEDKQSKGFSDFSGGFSTAVYKGQLYLLGITGSMFSFSDAKNSWTALSKHVELESMNPRLVSTGTELFAMAKNGAYIYKNGKFNLICKLAMSLDEYSLPLVV